MKAHWFCGLTEDPGKMTWAAAKVKFFFFFLVKRKEMVSIRLGV
jgi:hypothetical protein